MGKPPAMTETGAATPATPTPRLHNTPGDSTFASVSQRVPVQGGIWTKDGGIDEGRGAGASVEVETSAEADRRPEHMLRTPLWSLLNSAYGRSRFTFVRAATSLASGLSLLLNSLCASAIALVARETAD